eukprot:GFUD01018675.1.p1 GENE.GFUD01018675.1~~GFUD01018675.1.p1  ORF type:complete len:446 (+),score=97.86 GFUD01018675.1:46-1383(+)
MQFSQIRFFASSIARLEATSKPTCDLNPVCCKVIPCCMKGLINYSSQPALLCAIEPSVWSTVVKYSKYRPIPLSIENFLHHGEEATPRVSYNFLRREIPTRLAGLLLEFSFLPPLLQKQTAFQAVRDEHLETFQDLLAFPNNASDADLESFSEALTNTRIRHSDTVQKTAKAVMEMKFEMIDQKLEVDQGIETAVQYFLDRLYMTKISLSMLTNQHLYVHGGNIAKPRHVGQIDPHCDVVAEIRRAYSKAARLCDQHYGTHPEIKLVSSNRAEASDVPIRFAYVSSHLHHMFFEVFKNSMRATVERSKEGNMAKLEVRVSKTDTDITIKISDLGGGIPRSQMSNLFKYMYTSAGRVGKAHADAVKSSSIPPMAGLGYGLPLSRLYARYFQGDLDVSSVHGVGTDCFIYLRSMQQKAQIPVFSRITSKTYREKTIAWQEDWTGQER